MANVEQFENEAPLVTQRTGILATSSNAIARIREAIDQPSLGLDHFQFLVQSSLLT